MLCVIRLLTPPGTPNVPSSDGNESQPTIAASRSGLRSASAVKASRVCISLFLSFPCSLRVLVQNLGPCQCAG